MKIGRFARWYRFVEYAAFGKALERRRFAYLNRIADARTVLILGEGDGRVLARLAGTLPAAHFDVVEISPEMVQLAKSRLTGGRSQKWLPHFVCEDARTVEWPEARYDAILTFFFLDCFSTEDARTLIHRLSKALRPGGMWLLSEFAVPPGGWRRRHAQIWIRTMYAFFRVTTRLRANALPPIETLMTEAGLQRTARQEERAGMMISEVWKR